MSYSISQTAKLTGVSVRTLHYYDEIGLLSPSMVSETGYRYYDEAALEQLQQILFFRELEFPLKDIAQIMNDADYKKEEALSRQRQLLCMKRKRLEQLIRLLDHNLKGEKIMSFKEFDKTNIEEEKKKYAKEVKEKWGNTKAYEQSQKKTAGYTDEDWKKNMEKFNAILQKFAAERGTNPGDSEVQKLVEEWRNFITETYYDCTKEILSGLGKMYLADERFTKNMDRFGEGTTKLISDAIAIYCRK